MSNNKEDPASSPVPPPPPAPPDPPKDKTPKNGLTTGERIFSALRSVTSQSYIDASEFYKYVLPFLHELSFIYGKQLIFQFNLIIGPTSSTFYIVFEITVNDDG